MNDHQIIGQAIVFIENHLYETITARDAAEAVSYSYYHFHRYFSAVMGETIRKLHTKQTPDAGCVGL